MKDLDIKKIKYELEEISAVAEILMYSRPENITHVFSDISRLIYKKVQKIKVELL